MKKLIKKYGIMVLFLFLLVNCGKKNEEGKVSLPDPPTDIKYEGVALVDGPLSGYIEVVPGSYTLELSKDETKFLLGYNGKMKVKFKFLKPFDVKTGQGYNNYGPSLLGKALDAKGIPLDFSLDISTDSDLATYLKRGSGEEWLTLRISGQGNCDNAEEAAKQLEVYKKGKKIRFNSEIVEEKFDSEVTATSSSDIESTDVETTGGDCDEFLSGYEQFMDNYISILKKYKNNPTDASILSEYTSIMAEASEWSSKTSDCATDPKFASKFTAIQLKIASAAASGM